MESTAERMLMRYRYPDGRVQAALPMYIVRDSGDMVVGWTPVGTEIMYWATSDGSDPRTIALEERFQQHLGTARRHWQGGGILRVIPLDQPWQAIHFWDEKTNEFLGWYVNLESAKRRRGAAIDAVDWHLDLVVDRMMRVAWKDEDESAAAVGTSYLRDEDLEEARRTGDGIAADLAEWRRVVGDWRAYLPPADWVALDLPDDWDSEGDVRPW